MIGSKAFEEFIMARCEEIIELDKKCIQLNSEILKLEKELYPALSKEILDKVLKIDELTTELINQICVLFH